MFTGLRPGEKLYEEPLASSETTLPTPHPKLRIAQARAGSRDAVDQMVAWLERDRAAGDAEVRAWLKTWIPEYAPPGEIAVSGDGRGGSPGAPPPLTRAGARGDTPATLRRGHSQIADRRRDAVDVDRVHAARVRTFRESSSAAPHPRDLALEEHALIAAGKRVDGHRAKRRVAPELAGAADHRRSRAEERHRGRSDDTAEVGDAGVGRDQQRGVGEQPPQLRQ